MKQYLLSVMFAVLALWGVSYVSAVTNPTQDPPGGNVPAPLNVGDSPQIKIGGLDLGALTVQGGVVFKDSVQIPSLDAAEGKVLTSDADGNASWQDIPQESNNVLNQCVTMSTNINHQAPDYTANNGIRYFKFSLINQYGRNVCESTTHGENLGSGCSYILWRLNSDLGNDNQLMYGGSNYYYRQLFSGEWTDDKGPNRGDNGDGVDKAFLNWADNFYIYDDRTVGTYSENSPDEWSIRADNQNFVWNLSVCPAM